MRRKLFDTNNYISIHKIFSWGILKSYQTTISISIFEGLKVCSRCSRLTAENHCFSRILNGPRATTRKQKNHHGSGRIRMNPMLNSFFPQPPPPPTLLPIFSISAPAPSGGRCTVVLLQDSVCPEVSNIFSQCAVEATAQPPVHPPAPSAREPGRSGSVRWSSRQLVNIGPTLPALQTAASNSN